MAGIVFYFEDNDKDVWSGRDIDLDAWNYNCKVGGIDKVIIINKSVYPIRTFDGNMDVTIVEEMPELIGHVTQLVTPNEICIGETHSSLWDFDHNTDWYALGPADGWQGNHFGDQLITIPQNSLAYHHSVFIGSVIMYHRYSKFM